MFCFLFDTIKQDGSQAKFVYFHLMAINKENSEEFVGNFMWRQTTNVPTNSV
jgi:hypothetical protein